MVGRCYGWILIPTLSLHVEIHIKSTLKTSQASKIGYWLFTAAPRAIDELILFS